MKDVARRLNSSEQYGVVLHNILGRLRCIVKVLYNGMAEGFERWSSEACSGSIRSPPGIALKPKLSNQCSFVSFEHGHGWSLVYRQTVRKVSNQFVWKALPTSSRHLGTQTSTESSTETTPLEQDLATAMAMSLDLMKPTLPAQHMAFTVPNIFSFSKGQDGKQEEQLYINYAIINYHAMFFSSRPNGDGDPSVLSWKALFQACLSLLSFSRRPAIVMERSTTMSEETHCLVTLYKPWHASSTVVCAQHHCW